jgi:succinoglycan biosynthesis protein ExoL
VFTPQVKEINPILYLVPDLSDPATTSRLSMLQSGGAKILVFGFDRRPNRSKNFSFTSLGKTHDGKLFRRSLSVFRAIGKILKLLKNEERFDLILARNLEMLFIAGFIKRLPKYRNTKIVYECLDLHRTLLGTSLPSHLMQFLERYLLRNVVAVIVSSSEYIDKHFTTTQKYRGSFILLENKILDSKPIINERKPVQSPKIGLFGMLRCRKSIELLSELAESSDGLSEVIVAGLPSQAIFSNFEQLCLRRKKIKFLGAYSQSNIGTLYSLVDYAWCIDFYEQGLNSKLLLPNRLYESIAFGVIPIAMAGTATANWLEKQKVGKIFTSIDEIKSFFLEPSIDEIVTLRREIESVPRNNICYTSQDCIDLVNNLHRLK